MSRKFIAYVGNSLTLVGLLILAHRAQAVDYNWNNGAGGTFSTSGNWTPSGPPTTTADGAIFGLTGGYTVNFVAPAVSGVLAVTNSNAVIFDMQGNAYSVGSGADGPVRVANTASLVISSSLGGGTLNANAGGGFNSALVVGSGASLAINNSLGFPVTVTSQAGVEIGGTLSVHGVGTVYNNNVPGVFWHMLHGSTLNVADINNDNNEEGLLRGVGTISRFGAGLNFTLTNDGDFRPGDTNATSRIGTVAISGGDLVQNSGGTTFFDFASSGGNDFVSFSIGGGTATIGGTNVFTILNGYTPVIGDRWDFVLADDITYTASDNIHALMTSFGLQNDYMFGVFDSGTQEVLSLIIPEPSTSVLLAAAGLLMLRRRGARSSM